MEQYRRADQREGTTQMATVRDEVGPRPYRLVDTENTGWHFVAGGRYATPLEPDSWALERIAAERGPVREVVAAPEADLLLVHTALERAGRLAAVSLVVALHRVVVQYGSSGPIVA